MVTNQKRFLRYLFPSIFSMLVVAAYSFTDTFVVGRALGASGLAAIGIATPVLTALFALGFLFGAGGGAAYAITKGQGNNQRASRIYTCGILLACAFGVVILILGTVFIRDIALFLGADATNINETMEYMRWLFYFAPMLILDLTTNNYMRNDGKPNVAMSATMIGSAANVVLELLFVLVFRWGMFGASIATCMGSVIAVAINLTYSAIRRLDLKPVRVGIELLDIRRIVTNGFGPFLLNFSVAVLTFFYIAMARNLYGDLGVSTYAIFMNWNLIFMNLLLGVAQSSQPLISLSYGKGDLAAVKMYRAMTLKTALIMAFCFLPLELFLPEQLSQVFVQNVPELVTLSVRALRLSGATYLFMAFTICIGYYFESLEYPRQSLLVMMARGFICPVATLYLFSAFWGKDGLWLSIPAAEAISAVIAAILLRRTPVHIKQTLAAKTTRNR